MGKRLFVGSLLAILALAALLRWPALSTEFWFDEIWSWEFARSAATPGRIFLDENQHHDNNHKLNTLFLWFAPTGADWIRYRLHSFVAGLAAVALAALIAHRRGRAEAVFAALLFATDYWLVLCSAEARGYALAVCFALAAFYALQGYLANGSRRMLVLFWLSAMLGWCAHLTFLHCYLALGLWTVYDGARRRLGPRAELRRLLACHAVPALFFVALYLVDIRRMQLGGAPPLPTALVVGRLLSLGLGGGVSMAGTIVLSALAVLVLSAGLRLLARDELRVGLFFAVAIVGSPALFLLAKPAYLFERYFLISFVFFLLLISYVLAALWRHSRAGTGMAAVLTLAIVVGSIRQIVAFERGGRGHFVEALAYVAQKTPTGEVHLAGDYDFRVHKFFTFYAPYVADAARFRYDEQNALPPHGTDWLLTHRLDDTSSPLPRIEDANGNAYERVHDFPAAAFGGWHWSVYRNLRFSH